MFAVEMFSLMGACQTSHKGRGRLSPQFCLDFSRSTNKTRASDFFKHNKRWVRRCVYHLEKALRRDPVKPRVLEGGGLLGN